MDLLILDVSYTWNHIFYGFLCLEPWHNVFEVHPCCSMYQYFFLFVAKYHSTVEIYHIWSVHSLVDGPLIYFQVLAIVSSDTMTILMQVFVSISLFNSFGYIPRSGIAGSYSKFMFILMKCQTGVHNDYTICIPNSNI